MEATNANDSRSVSPANSSNSEPSLGNRCLSYLKTGKCRFGDKCRYARIGANSEQAYKGAQQSHMQQLRDAS
eukprot:6128568-Amphidinium_carterae.3